MDQFENDVVDIEQCEDYKTDSVQSKEVKRIRRTQEGEGNIGKFQENYNIDLCLEHGVNIGFPIKVEDNIGQLKEGKIIMEKLKSNIVVWDCNEKSKYEFELPSDIRYNYELSNEYLESAESSDDVPIVSSIDVTGHSAVHTDINFDPTVMNLEMLQAENSKKMRIRNVTYSPKEDINYVVLLVLKYPSFSVLDECDLRKCQRVNNWDSLYQPRDILVTFFDQTTRDLIYNNRKFIEKDKKNLIHIEDELVEERISIWKRAIAYFGNEIVRTRKGCISIRNLYNEKSVLIYTMGQLRAVIEDNRRKLWRSSPYASQTDLSEPSLQQPSPQQSSLLKPKLLEQLLPQKPSAIFSNYLQQQGRT